MNILLTAPRNGIYGEASFSAKISAGNSRIKGPSIHACESKN